MVTINGIERYYDEYLLSNLDYLKKMVEANWDGIIYYGGYEGDGKTVKASQDAAYLDPTFTLERFCWTPKRFLELVNVAQKGQAIVYDEGQDVFDSGATRDKTARLVKTVLTRIRSKNLYIIIIAPDFWRINKYLFIHRSRAFIRIYSDGLTRGYFAFYSREKKHALYIKGKKEENINVITPDFRGRFTNWVPFDWDEYNKRKDEATKSITLDDEAIEPATKQLITKHQVSLLKFLQRNQWIKKGAMSAAAGFLQISDRTLRNYAEDDAFSGQNDDFSLEKPLVDPENGTGNNHYYLSSTLKKSRTTEPEEDR